MEKKIDLTQYREEDVWDIIQSFGSGIQFLADIFDFACKIGGGNRDGRDFLYVEVSKSQAVTLPKKK